MDQVMAMNLRTTSLVSGERNEALSVGRELPEEAGRLLEVDESVVGVDVGVEAPRRAQKVPLVARPVDLAVEESRHDVLRLEPSRAEALSERDRAAAAARARLGRHVLAPLALRLARADAIGRLLLGFRHVGRSRHYCDRMHRHYQIHVVTESSSRSKSTTLITAMALCCQLSHSRWRRRFPRPPSRPSYGCTDPDTKADPPPGVLCRPGAGGMPS